MSNPNDKQPLSVTNNTSDTVAVLDFYSTNSKSTAMIFEETLTLAETTDGSKTISSGSTETVDLSEVSSKLGLKTPLNAYSLLFVRGSDSFPYLNQPVNFGPLDPKHPSVSVDSDSVDNMKLGLKFVANIQAFPTSDLAKNYAAALNTTTNAANPDDSNNAISQFFANTTAYKNLNNAIVTTVQTWLNTFPLIWTGFNPTTLEPSQNDNQTFYLYSPGTESGGNATAAPKSQGKLVLTRTNNSPDPGDKTSGYTCEYQPDSGDSTRLTYQKGQFVSNPGSELNPIAIQPTFVLKSTLTNNTSDNVLIPMVVGTVNGVKVMGTTTEQTSESSWYAFWHPKTFRAWLNLILSLFGIAMAVEFVGKGLYSISKKIRGTKDPIEQLREEVKSLKEEMRADSQARLNDVGDNSGANVPEGKNVQSAIDSARMENADSQLNNLKDQLQTQNDRLKEIEKYKNDPEVQGEFEKLNKSYEKIDKFPSDATLAEKRAAISDVKSSLSESIEKIGNIQESIENEISHDTQAKLNDLKTNQENLEEEMEAHERAAEDSESDGNDDFDEDM